MEATEFVTGVRQRVIESDFLVYQTSLDSPTNGKDQIWREILPIYNGLTKEEKMSFLKFLRMVQANTVSHVLGILDGRTFLNEKRENLVLTTESDNEIINGDLQDIFLEMEEGWAGS